VKEEWGGGGGTESKSAGALLSAMCTRVCAYIECIYSMLHDTQQVVHPRLQSRRLLEEQRLLFTR